MNQLQDEIIRRFGVTPALAEKMINEQEAKTLLKTAVTAAVRAPATAAGESESDFEEDPQAWRTEVQRRMQAIEILEEGVKELKDLQKLTKRIIESEEKLIAKKTGSVNKKEDGWWDMQHSGWAMGGREMFAQKLFNILTGLDEAKLAAYIMDKIGFKRSIPIDEEDVAPLIPMNLEPGQALPGEEAPVEAPVPADAKEVESMLVKRAQISAAMTVTAEEKIAKEAIVVVEGDILLKGVREGKYRIENLGDGTYQFYKPNSPRPVSRHRTGSVDISIKPKNHPDLNKIVIVKMLASTSVTAESENDLEDDDWVIQDARRGGYDVGHYQGKRLGTYDDLDEAMKDIAKQMDKEKFWPNVWYVGERGDINLVEWKKKGSKIEYTWGSTVTNAASDSEIQRHYVGVAEKIIKNFLHKHSKEIDSVSDRQGAVSVYGFILRLLDAYTHGERNVNYPRLKDLLPGTADEEQRKWWLNVTDARQGTLLKQAMKKAAPELLAKLKELGVKSLASTSTNAATTNEVVKFLEQAGIWVPGAPAKTIGPNAQWEALKLSPQAKVTAKRQIIAQLLKSNRPDLANHVAKTPLGEILGRRKVTAGYTHYWDMTRDFDDGEWKRITNGARKIIYQASEEGIETAGPMGTDSPKITPKMIALNGVKPDHYESFVLVKTLEKMDEGDASSHFCKTARKPYDAVVVSILALVKKVAPDAVDIRSDGGPSVFTKPAYKVKAALAKIPDGLIRHIKMRGGKILKQTKDEMEVGFATEQKSAEFSKYLQNTWELDSMGTRKEGYHVVEFNIYDTLEAEEE